MTYNKSIYRQAGSYTTYVCDIIDHVRRIYVECQSNQYQLKLKAA